MKKVPDFIDDPEAAKRVRRISEETLDTTEDLGVKLSGISRRDFMQISKRYGLTATYVAAAGMGGVFSAGALATKAEAAEEERKKAKHVLKYGRSEEHTSELQSLMRISYAVFCLKKKKKKTYNKRIANK